MIAWGPGPRASQAMMLAVRAKAMLDGRLAPSIDDVLALAEPILKHRMALTFAARTEGQDRVQHHRPACRPVGVDIEWRHPVRRHERSAGKSGAAAQILGLEGDAHGLAESLPDLVAEAMRISLNVSHGIHGRRRAARARRSGSSGNTRRATRRQLVDWRRSASSDHLFVREREWEAAHTDLAVAGPVAIDGVQEPPVERDQA